jgi:sugar phosphate isomerase/epimerase
MWTRRDWLRTTLGTAAAMPLAAAETAWGSQSLEVFRIRGVRIALQSASFSFSDLALPDIFTTMQGMGLKELDIMSEHIEHLLGAPGIQLPGAGRPGPWARAATPAPPNGAPAVRQAPRGMAPEVREALRAWRLGVDLAQFREVKARFDRAGLILFSYNLSFNDSYTDAEIERGLLMAKALGTRIITASSPLSVLPRVAPLAMKHDVIVAVHNHMEGPEYFAHAMALSPNLGVNLDVGHFFAMGHDPIAYLKTHLSRITNLHIKDRMSERGAEKPFGQGETPLADVLRLVRDQKYDLPVCIEYVGPDGPAVEIKRCLDYCRTILET